jgi:hypothetical protein
MNLEKIESVFFSGLEDVRDYPGDLTLVGGGMPLTGLKFQGVL